MRLTKFFPVIIGLSLLSAGLYGCKEQNAYAPPPPPMVTVSKPVVQDTTYYLYKTGRFVANQEIDITARVTGILEQRLFVEGQMMQAGESLYIIEQTRYKAAVDEAKAGVASAEAQRRMTQAVLTKSKGAYKDLAISEVDVIQAQANYDLAVASVDNAKAMLIDAELNFSYTEIKAPITGRISRSLVDVGNLVGLGGQNTLLTTIVDDNILKVYFSVTEKELAVYLADGTPRVEEQTEADKHRYSLSAAVGSSSKFEHPGVVDFVDNAVDSNTGTFLLRGKFINPDKKLVTGMFTRIRIPLRIIKDALTVPEIALGQSQAGYYIVTVDKDNTAHVQNVDVAFIQEGLAVITDGLTADAMIIINGMALAQDGGKVSPQTAAQPPDGEQSSQNKDSGVKVDNQQ